MANIFDVASLSGVSKTTVSKVLNNQYGVKQETREKVLWAAKQLNYIPNQAAKNLVTNRSGVIGLLSQTNFKLSVFVDLSIYLQKYANDLGYSLVFANYNSNAALKDKYFNYFMGGAADGLIVFGSSENDIKYVENMQTAKYPFVVVENQYENLEINNILIDNVQGSKDIVEHVISLGHKNIAYVAWTDDQKISWDRLYGYKLALNRNSIPINQEFIQYTNLTNASVRAAIGRLMALKTRPSAICFFNDIMAFCAIEELNSLGYRIPEDISVAGFDNFSGTFEFLENSIKLTSVQQPIEEISKAAINLLVDNINHKDMNSNQLTFCTSLIKGNSCSLLK